MIPRLKELYYKEIQPALKEKLGFKNIATSNNIRILNYSDISEQVKKESDLVFNNTFHHK